MPAHATLLQNAARKCRASAPLFKPLESTGRRVRDLDSELRMMAEFARTLAPCEFRQQLYLKQDPASMRKSIKLCGMLHENQAAREFLVENLTGQFAPEAATGIAKSFFLIRKMCRKIELFAYLVKEIAGTRSERAELVKEAAENLFSGFAPNGNPVLLSAFRLELAAYIEKNPLLLSDPRC